MCDLKFLTLFTHFQPAMDDGSHISDLSISKAKTNIQINRCDNLKPKFNCVGCGKKFVNQSKLKEHIEKFTETNMSECPKCEQKFSKVDLDEHITAHIDESCPPCKNCGKTFTHILSLHIHLSLQCSEPTVKTDGYLTCREKTYRCTKCQNVYTKKMNLREHMKICAQDAEYFCTICTNSYRKLFNLKKHELEHSNNSQLNSKHKPPRKEKPILCTLCANTLKTKRGFESHMIKHKTEPYHCSKCNHFF